MRLTGSPPPTRGTRYKADTSDGFKGITPAYAGNTLEYVKKYLPNRITPAYAGNTHFRQKKSGRNRDHPRLRGEHLSPRSIGFCFFRITPAYAGNTTRRPLRLFNYKDHPRLRGEHNNSVSGISHIEGSPPPTRGTRSRFFSRCFMGRITPAYAGNTDLTALHQDLHWDHPRLRGEHTTGWKGTGSATGSPPPTRGTLYNNRTSK